MLMSDDESNKTGNESTTYPVIDSGGIVSLSSDAISSKSEDESDEYTIVELETDADTNPVSNINVVTSSDADTFFIASDEETEVESEEESTSESINTESINKRLRESIIKEQILRTWTDLVEVAEDNEEDEVSRSFADTVADIVEWWQTHSKDGTPLSHYVNFGVSSPVNLLMVLALLPERYQHLICIEDERRSPSSNGENLSWLHEQTTDLLVRLSTDPAPASMRFGQGLASMIRDSVDEGWRTFTGRSWLEDQLHLQSIRELEPDQYRFPPGTEKVVFLFNPTEIHWTVVEVEIDDYAWTYTLYNSLSQNERGPTWKACQEQIPLLEQLICRASGFPEPTAREITMANSAQQENMYDCGPFAIYNAVELLEGRKPSTEIDPEELRLKYLRMIRDALYVVDQGLETSAFRTYMRRVCLDYLP